MYILYVLTEYKYNLYYHFKKNVLTIINSNFIYILFQITITYMNTLNRPVSKVTPIVIALFFVAIIILYGFFSVYYR